MIVEIGILDDSPMIVDVLRGALTLSGHRVSAYTNPLQFCAEAIRKPNGALANAFDILIIDLNLSGDVSGEDVIQQVRLQQPLLPIVLVSAAPQMMLQKVRDKFSSVILLHKPFTLIELFAAIDGACT
jgi:DNA-binding response OmpR family regulator